MTDALREALAARFERLPKNAASTLPKEPDATIDVMAPRPNVPEHKAARGRRTVTADQIREAIHANRARIVDEAAFRLGLFGGQLGLNSDEQAMAARWWPLVSAHPEANDAWLVELLRAFTELPCIGWPFGRHAAAVNEWWLGVVSLEPTPNGATTLYDNIAPIDAVALYLAKHPLAAHRAQVEAIARGDATKAQLASVWQEVAEHLRANRNEAPATQADFDALESAVLATVKEWREKLDALGDVTDVALFDALRELIKTKHTKTAEEPKPETPWATWRLVSKKCGAPPWLTWLTEAVWRGEVSNTRAFVVSGVEVGGDRWSRLPKETSAVSWAFGGVGTVEVDGERYATEPGVTNAVWLPPTYDFLTKSLPEHKDKPHQTALPIAYDEEPQPLVVAVTNANQYAISPLAAKVFLLALASEDLRNGRRVETTARELASLLHPHLARNVQAREIEKALSAAVELRSLLMVCHDRSTVQMLAVRAELPQKNGDVNPDGVVAFALDPHFHHAVSKTQDALPRAYRGDFLVNIDGLMRIPANKPAELRLAVRAAAGWNAAFDWKTKTFDASFLPKYTLKQLGAITNTIPPSALDFTGPKLAAAQRRKSSAGRKNVLGNLEELRKRGLLNFDTEGKGEGQMVRVLPTDAYLEAKRKAVAVPTPTRGRKG